MREFAALYNHNTGIWSIIYRDPNDKEWRVFIQDVDGKDNAYSTVDALNKAAGISRPI